MAGDTFDNWDLMPDPNAISDPWITEPGYGGYEDPGTGGYTSPGDSEQQTAGDQVAAGGGYGMGGLTEGGSGSSMSSALMQLAKMFGLTGKDGSINSGGMLQLLGMLGTGAGAYMSNNATKDATSQMLQGLKDSNAAATGILQPQMDKYAPYQAAGTQALSNMQANPYKPMAGNFAPVTRANPGFTLGSLLRGR